MGRLKTEITSVPAGEAPLEVRRCWVGLFLDLAEGHAPTPYRMTTHSILIYSDSWRHRIRRALGLLPPLEPWTGYIVSTAEAAALLERTHPDATRWWRENAPHLFGRTVIFRSDCCRLMTNDNG